ncbi:hypothetical protein BJ165DRAFT_1329405, partial [Panaeolus papilionaceus]
PVEEFFRQYENKPDVPFVYNPNESAPSNFKSLWKALDYPEDDDERHDLYEFRQLKRAYNRALINQFNRIYGMKDNIEGWRALCRATGNTNPPREITECKAIMRRTHVNLVDLTEWIGSRSSRFVTIFENVKALSLYTLSNDKIFPRDELQAGDILKFFLRQI